jgi:DNA-binding CsgD family transcriptional regulator
METGRMMNVLSERERQVARLYTDGQSYKQIGRSLGVSPATVRTHLNAIYRKLEVSNNVELIFKITDFSCFSNENARQYRSIDELPLVLLHRLTVYSDEHEAKLAAEMLVHELAVDLARFKELRQGCSVLRFG